MTKSLKEISWNVSEDTYRKDPALSYSTLAKFEREGFNKLDSLFDHIDTPSLTFGSAVDSIITGGEEEFNTRFMVAEFPSIPDSIISIVKHAFEVYKDQYTSLEEIPNSALLPIVDSHNYQQNWKPETRIKVIKEKGEEYYKLLYIAQDKTILSQDIYQDVINAVNALKESPSTSQYFIDNPFGNIEQLYQLKFKHTFNNIEYRGMMDLVIVDHDKKLIIPVDLKTSGKPEWEFYKSFATWRYDLQSRLYWRLLRANMNEDDYFKDFKLANYRFIVVNRKTLTPLVWEFTDTQAGGELVYGAGFDIKMRDPFIIGEELHNYLESKPKVPKDIYEDRPNSIVKWINRVNNW